MLIDQQGSLTVVAHPLAQWIEAETEVKDDLMDGVGPLLTGQFGASLHLKLHVAQSGGSTELVVTPVIGETTGCDCRSNDAAHSSRHHVFSSLLDNDDGIHIDARVIVGPMMHSIYAPEAQDQLRRYLDLLLDHAADELDYAAEARCGVAQADDCWFRQLPTAVELIALISENLSRTSLLHAGNVSGRKAYRPSTDGRELAWQGITADEADFLQLDWVPDTKGALAWKPSVTLLRYGPTRRKGGLLYGSVPPTVALATAVSIPTWGCLVLTKRNCCFFAAYVSCKWFQRHTM